MTTRNQINFNKNRNKEKFIVSHDKYFRAKKNLATLNADPKLGDTLRTL